MKRIPVESSCVAEIGYDPGQQLLEVKLNRGTVYHYPDVSEDDYQAFVSADSIGSYYQKVISKLPFVRIN